MKIGWVLVGLLAATPITAQGLSKSKSGTAKVLKRPNSSPCRIGTSLNVAQQSARR